MKMDGEILELKYLYERELKEEIMQEKSMFLCSRGIKHRLDKVIKARNLLCANMKNAMNSTHTFTLELAMRKDAVRKAEEALKYLHKDINDAATLLATLQLGGSDSALAENASFHYKRLCRELPIAERRIRDKERAVNNWLERGKEKCQKMSNDKLGKFYDVQKDVDALYGQLPASDTKDALEAINANNVPKWQKEIAEKAIELENNPGSYVEPEAIDTYSETKSLIKDAPIATRAIEHSNAGLGDFVFKEIPKDNSDLPFKKWRSAQPDDLGERQESEEENVPIMPSDSPSIAD